MKSQSRSPDLCTMEAANVYLEKEFLPWWNQTLTVKPAQADDAHRPLGKEHNLAAILSHVEQRQIINNYTLSYDAKAYKIHSEDIQAGMRKAFVRVEERLDGSIAVRFQGRYIRVSRCAPPIPGLPASKPKTPPRAVGKGKPKSDWMKNFSIRSARTSKGAK